ncbi:MAG: hypothetical protein JST10_16445 [Bacteroidetes bacterium]|nr:hypothetical protein [Bacteroidota bacterium]MBS1634153.1 hypothetical protein [Bacteroidota bacterium]
METSLKQELHKLVDKCDNELLLEEAKILLQTDKDLCDEVSGVDENFVTESEPQYGKGVYISQRELINLYQRQNNAELTPGQKLALDKELESIKNNPEYLLKWNIIKSRLKKS